MIMLKRWKNGRELEPLWRDSSGTILLRTALTERGRSSNISRAYELGPRVVPCHIGNTVPSQGLSAQNARFSFRRAVSRITFFGHESSDEGLSFRISSRRCYRECGRNAEDSR